MKKIIFWLIVLGVAALGVRYVWASWSADKAALNAEIKKAEGLALAVENYKVATEANEKAIAERVAENAALQSQVDEAIREVKRLTNKKPEVIETVKWKTETIEVPVEKIIRVPITEVVPADCVDCVRGFIDKLPPVKFTVAGVTAKLRTDKGNTFLEGVVSLQSESLLGQDAEVLGTAPYQKDVTEILTKAEKKSTWLRHRIAATKITDVFDWSLKYEYQLTRRIGVVAGVFSGAEQCLSDNDYGTQCLSSSAFEAGLSFSF